MSNYVTYENRVRITLSHKYNEDFVLNEDPEGWDSEGRIYTRKKDWKGVFTEITNNLKFRGEAKAFIERIYFGQGEGFGINAEIKVIREEKHPYTDVFEVTSEGYLDLSTAQVKSRALECKYNSSKFLKELDKNKSEKVEIDRNTTLKGEPISDLETHLVLPVERGIFLKTTYDVRPPDNDVFFRIKGDFGTKRHLMSPLPFQLLGQSHEIAVSPIRTTEFREINYASEVELIFFLNAKLPRQLKIKGKIRMNFSDTFHRPKNSNFSIRLLKYANGDQLDLVSEELKIFDSNNYGGTQSSIYTDPVIGDIKGTVSGIENMFGTNYTLNFEQDVLLNVGESLALIGDLWLEDSPSAGDPHTDFRLNLSKSESFLSVTEDSEFASNLTKAIKPNHLFTRLIEIITGKKDRFKSTLYQGGESENLLTTHGHWLRGYERVEGEVNEDDPNRLFKPYSTSFKEAFDSYAVMDHASLGLEVINGKEMIVMEKMSYFYFSFVTIDLSQIPLTNVEWKVADDLYYNGVDVGYTKGGDYEEVMGLDEPNAQSNYIMPIDTTDVKYTAQSKFRNDGYGKELTKRKSIQLFPTEDYSADKDKFFIDAVPNGNFLREGVYSDFGYELPKNIYSPETLSGIRHTPGRILIKHGELLSASLLSYPNSFISHGSNEGNSLLETQEVGEQPLAENQPIGANRLEKALFRPRIWSGDFVFDFFNRQLFKEYVEVGGVKIPKRNGILKFWLGGEKYLYGYVRKIDVAKNKIEIIEANYE